MENNIPSFLVIAIILIILLSFIFIICGIMRVSSKNVSVRSKYWNIRRRNKSGKNRNKWWCFWFYRT